MPNSFLLICYSYPPYPGTGGRRWAKLSKYLAQAGNHIHVINAISKNKSSIWEKDSNHVNITIHSVNNKFENTINGIKSTLLSKIIKKIIFFLSKIKTNANYSDQSLWWNHNAYLNARDIIKKNKIDYLIISCPPYHIMDKFSELKNEFPSITLILDYRDIWTIGQKRKGFFSHLSDNRFINESSKEINTIEKADVILTVAEEMTQAIKEKFPKKKVFTIYNGFDEEDVYDNYVIENKAHLKPNKRNILFAGSLVTDSNPYAIPFFDALIKLKHEKPELYDTINLCVFGTLNTVIHQLIDKHELNCISIFPQVSSKAIGKIYKDFDFLLLFLNPYYTYAFISKFFDYLPARKPIICISESGSFPSYLEDNCLGKNIEPQTIYVNLVDILNTEHKIKFDISFDISQFNYRNLSQKILEILHNNDEK